MNAAGAAARDQREIAHVVALLGADFGDQVAHHRIDGAGDQLRRPVRVGLEQVCHTRERLLRALGIELDVPAEEVIRVDVAQSQIGIGHRRPVTLAVGRRSRVGAGALRADAQQAERVHPGERPATGAHGGHIDHLDRDPVFPYPRIRARRYLSLLDDADVETRASHVHRQEILLVVKPAEVQGAVGSRGGTRIEQVHGAVHAFFDHLHHAVGEHHEQAAGEAALLETALQFPRVADQRRADIGADNGGGEAFELTEYRQDLVRGRNIGIGRHLLHDALRLALVLAIGIGVQETYRDGGAALVEQFPGAGAQLGLVQGSQNLAGVQSALLHTEAKVRRDQRLVRIDEQIEHGAAQLAYATAHFHNVAKALGGEDAHLGAPLGDQNVGAQGGAVDDLIHAGEELLERLLVVVGSLPHRGEGTQRGVFGRRRGLESLQLPRFLHNQAVSESSAHVDGQLLHRACSACSSSGWISTPSVSSFTTAP